MSPRQTACLLERPKPGRVARASTPCAWVVWMHGWRIHGVVARGCGMVGLSSSRPLLIIMQRTVLRIGKCGGLFVVPHLRLLGKYEDAPVAGGPPLSAGRGVLPPIVMIWSLYASSLRMYDMHVVFSFTAVINARAWPSRGRFYRPYCSNKASAREAFTHLSHICISCTNWRSSSCSTSTDTV